MPDKLLPPRSVIYVEGLKAGKTKKQAAIDAGYSPNSKPAAIERQSFGLARAIARICSPDRLAETVCAGLEATDTKEFCSDGVVIEGKARVAWSERRQTARLVAELAGWAPKDAPGQQVVAVQVQIKEF